MLSTKGWSNKVPKKFLFVLLLEFCKLPVKDSYNKYPLLELIGICLSTILLYSFPSTDHRFLWALLLTWGLLGLACIDAIHFILPDKLLFPLWVGGCIANGVFNVFATPASVFFGSGVGYFSLYLISKIYFYVTGRVGLGQGDIKLLGLLGAWLGLEALPMILWIASSTGLIFALSKLLLKQQTYSQPIPFGPFLALGGWICLLFH